MKTNIIDENQIIITNIVESSVIINDIAINAGADFSMDLEFTADDGSDIGYYGIMVYNGRLMMDDQSSVVGERWDADSTVWAVDGETIYGSSNWNLQAQLREFPEAFDYFDFDFDLDEDGIHMQLDRNTTALITYIRGVYDVFITDSNGVRAKLIQGTARIQPQITR